MGRDRNSFRHSLSDGGRVPQYYITVNRPDMILEVKPDQVRGALASLSMLSYRGKGTFPPLWGEMSNRTESYAKPETIAE